MDDDSDYGNNLPYTSVFDVAHFLLCMTDASMDEKLVVLCLTDTKSILQEIQSIVIRYLQALDDSQKIQQSIEEKLDTKRREFYLRQQQQDDLCLFMPKQDDDDDTSILKNQLNNAGLPSHIQSIIKRDLNRLSKIPSAAPESTLLRTYLEWIADLPWKNSNHSNVLEISTAKYQLNADHFGLDYVKRRILEYLSVLKVKKDTASSPILCFVGPPGVGKTTLAISIAKALQRKFHRIALGGVRDEAEIRGHRRTYVGALPGLIISGLRKAGVNNPLFLLDEIDKIVQGTHQGDPAAALLEVLDPAQNTSFTDHFLNVPFDLSNILFIATANSLDTIPPALLDRMEVIQLHGYTMDEKLDIAKSYLVPKQLFAHGFSNKENDAIPTLYLSDQVLTHLIENYTIESGVRSLDRVIASVCRYKCREYADSLENASMTFNPTVLCQDLDTILGIAPYGNEALDTHATPGLVNGLAYSQSGCGGVLPIEANQMPGQGQLKLTGSLGDVIKESAHIALSWIKANAYHLRLTSHEKERLLSDMDLHLHIPNGAQKKDGPSAGVAMTICMISLFSGKIVPRKTAMTGEITLSGKVMPVGGIKEKVISAHRAGVTKVILPLANKKDLLQDVPDKVKNDLTIVYCQHISEVLEAAFNEKFDHDTLTGYPIQYASRL
ncbi:ATP-dependent protease La [Cunninghamella echinulata]|nr:ATP-dependent protease La [Cunninghamella echinulata]